MNRRRPTWILCLLLAACVRAPAADLDERQPLAGVWRFALDPADAGLAARWFATNLPDRIQLPGILEAQGRGDLVGIHTPWMLTLYDHFWYLRRDYAADTNAGRVRVPFLCQPPRHYLGAAWYQRDVEIPAAWAGRRLVLFLERPHWKTTVWLDTNAIGSDLSLCTPHQFDFGYAPPGRHRLTIRVDNRLILPYRPDAHAISDSLDNAWNGIAGRIEFRTTPPVWIADAQVFTDITRKTARVRLEVGNLTGRSGRGTLTWVPAGAAPAHPPATWPVTWQADGGRAEIVLPANPSAGLWDEFHPALQTGVLRLQDGDRVDARPVSFGFRDFRAAGRQFTLNGRPVFFRGTHFGGDFPLTGCPPVDVPSWRRLLQTCQAYGLNHMRFHSWCPPEAAFTAADELGMYLQVEPGMWNAFAPDSVITGQLYAETGRILRDYGNHPSLMLVSASNEASGRWRQTLPEWVRHFRAADPRRLYTPDTGWSLLDDPGQPLAGGADYLDVGRIGSRRVRGVSGWFGGDYRDAIAGETVPVISHEVGQWCAYPDFDLIHKFTGFMQPGNFEIFRDSARAHGVLRLDHAFAAASGAFQLACYKEEIEAALRTPGLGGFQLLDLHDYTGQGTALVGVLDPFWQSKGYATPADFREFCQAVVPLARLDRRSFTTSDTLDAAVEAVNYGPAPLPGATVGWTIQNAAGQILRQGSLGRHDLPWGQGWPLGRVHAALAGLPAPAACRLTVTLDPSAAPGSASAPPQWRNHWNFWLYPAAQAVTNPPAVFQTSSWPEARQRLAAGGRVLLTPRTSELSWWSPPLAATPVFWNALMGPTWSRMLGLWCDLQSPALAEFPTAAHCDWQWTPLIRHARAINLDRLPDRLQPMVAAIDDWNRNYRLAVIFEARVGPGRLLVCTADLRAGPAGAQLRRSLLDYAAGNQFSPRTRLTPDAVGGLFQDNLVMRQLGAVATADGQPAGALVDADPDTFWCSADARGRGPKPPHLITVSFPRPVPIHGLLLMPRQNQREHQGDIRGYQVETSLDGARWQTVARGELASTFDPQTIEFHQTITLQRLRLRALSGFGTDQSAALAELAVLYAGPPLPEPSDDLEDPPYQNVPTASPDIDAGSTPVQPGGARP